jgi:hypothetical protein
LRRGAKRGSAITRSSARSPTLSRRSPSSSPGRAP